MSLKPYFPPSLFGPTHFNRLFSGVFFETGLAYLENQGVEGNLETAVHYFSRAADQNHPRAIFYLANCYASGRGVDKNLQTAIDLLERLMRLKIESTDADGSKVKAGAQCNLAIYLIKHSPGDINVLQRAISLFEQAVEGGCDHARAQLARALRLLEEAGEPARAAPRQGP